MLDHLDVVSDHRVQHRRLAHPREDVHTLEGLVPLLLVHLVRMLACDALEGLGRHVSCAMQAPHPDGASAKPAVERAPSLTERESRMRRTGRKTTMGVKMVVRGTARGETNITQMA